MPVRISRLLLDRLLAEAGQSPDREICGLLLGQGDRIEAAIPVENVSDSPNNSFEIDPQILFEQIRYERAGNHALLGHYHSHPGGVAEPSARDGQSAHGDGGRLWLILSGDQATLWRFAEDGGDRNGFGRVPLVVD